MSRFHSALRVLAAAVLQLAATVPLAAQRELAGRYTLEGVREMGAELVLGPGGRFEFGLAYGALDQVARGSWSRRGDRVVLVSDRPPPPAFTSATMEPRPEAQYERLGKAAPLVVRVVTPEEGMGWRGAEVVVELSDGRTRTGTTMPGGRVEFPVAEWRGARLRRVGVAFPPGGVARRWFTIPDPAVRTMIVELAPGNLIKPAFETRTVHVTTERGRAALRMHDVPGLFVRR